MDAESPEDLEDDEVVRAKDDVVRFLGALYEAHASIRDAAKIKNHIDYDRAMTDTRIFVYAIEHVGVPEFSNALEKLREAKSSVILDAAKETLDALDRVNYERQFREHEEAEFFFDALEELDEISCTVEDTEEVVEDDATRRRDAVLLEAAIVQQAWACDSATITEALRNLDDLYDPPPLVCVEVRIEHTTLLTFSLFSSFLIPEYEPFVSHPGREINNKQSYEFVRSAS